MANFLRFLLGIALLPACWGAARSLLDALVAAAGASGGLSPEAVALAGGIAAFALAWMAVPHPVRTYVLGHELTHALWGLMFGARPSDLRVSAGGGSVRLTRSNLVITLAPYFFPFYTFVVIVCALVTCAFMRPLPFLPMWTFLIGFTWAFHVLFTISTLTQRQPDVTLYGRVFSWSFIFLANVGIVLAWLAAATPLTFAELGGILCDRMASAYVGVCKAAFEGGKMVVRICSRT